MPCSQPEPAYSTPAMRAIATTTPTRSAMPWRVNRSSPIAIMKALPTGTAAARKVLGHDRAGVCTTHSSCAYSVIGPIRIASSRQGAATARVSAQACARGLQNDTSAVVRMWAPRRSATAAPRLASHRNRIDASSSAQGIGLLKMKRETTPASSTTTSPTTSAAAGISTLRPSQRSARASKEPSGWAVGAASMAVLTGLPFHFVAGMSPSGGRACSCTAPGAAAFDDGLVTQRHSVVSSKRVFVQDTGDPGTDGWPFRSAALNAAGLLCSEGGSSRWPGMTTSEECFQLKMTDFHLT